MSFIYKNNISISIFGTSHSQHMGIILEGIEAGIKIDHTLIKKEIIRRKPINKVSTSRIEKDEYEIISGEFNGFTTGDNITIIVSNNNKISKHYESNIIRPNHADYPSYIKSKGYHDYRGGGKFSGRLTVLIVIIGAIAKQVIKSKENIDVYSNVKNIGNIYDKPLYAEDKNITNLQNSTTPTNSIIQNDKMLELVKNIKSKGDSIGGSINVYAKNVRSGLGEPYFDSFESVFSHLMYSIPGVKAVEFGKGVDYSTSKGSEVSDELSYINDKVHINDNNNGGINGGLTNSNVILSTITFKPTPSIYLEQKTIDIDKKQNINYQINGRHDPCIALRTAVICEAIMSLTILDFIC